MAAHLCVTTPLAACFSDSCCTELNAPLNLKAPLQAQDDTAAQLDQVLDGHGVVQERHADANYVPMPAYTNHVMPLRVSAVFHQLS
jgi:hypothetical protein